MLTDAFSAGSRAPCEKQVMSKAGPHFPASGRTDQGVTIMFKKIALSTALAASALTALPAAADAQSRYGYSRYDNGTRYNGYSNYGCGYDNRYYGQRYSGQRYSGQRYYAQRYGNYYGRRCRSDGSVGTIIGAIAGGLLGSEIAGRGDRTTGAIIGGAAGALAGRAIDRDDCRR